MTRTERDVDADAVARIATAIQMTGALGVGSVADLHGDFLAILKERNELRSRVLELQAPEVHWDCQQTIDRLEERRDELLQTIARLSNTVPFPGEWKNWESQRAKLIAEVGSLKAERDEALRQAEASRNLIPLSVLDACQAVTCLQQQNDELISKLDPLEVENSRLRRELHEATEWAPAQASCLKGLRSEHDRLKRLISKFIDMGPFPEHRYSEITDDEVAAQDAWNAVWNELAVEREAGLT